MFCRCPYEFAYMINLGDNVICEFIWTPTKHLNYDMFAVELKDIHHYYTTYFVNDGISADGISEVGTPSYVVIDKTGAKSTITISDMTLENMNMGTDQLGRTWEFIDGFWKQEFKMPDMTGSFSSYFGYDRNDVIEFSENIKKQEILATNIWNSNNVQKLLPSSFGEDHIKYPRLHDSTQNMAKAKFYHDISRASMS